MKKFIIAFIILVLILILFPIRSAASPLSPQQPITPPEIEKLIEEYQSAFTLTIYYIYIDGRVAAPTYKEVIDVGVMYNIVSPTIKNYNPNIKIVEGIMPARNIEYVVIYITDDIYIIDNYEIPLSFGMTTMNLGVCIE